MDESGDFRDGPCVPRFKFALRGAFASTADQPQTDQKEMPLRVLSLRETVLKYWSLGATPLWFCVQNAIFGSENGFSSEPSPDTESTRMSGEPDTVTSSKQ